MAWTGDESYVMLSKTEILSPSSNYDRKHIFLSNMGLVVTSALHTYQLKNKMIGINDHFGWRTHRKTKIYRIHGNDGIFVLKNTMQIGIQENIIQTRENKFPSWQGIWICPWE